MKGNKPYNKTIMSVVQEEEAIPRLREILDEVCGGLSSPGTGILFSLPVDFAVGLVGQEPNGQGVTMSDAISAILQGDAISLRIQGKKKTRDHPGTRRASGDGRCRQGR
jgi:hypothetical protein